MDHTGYPPTEINFMSLDGPAIANHETFEETVRRLFGEAEAARGTGFAVRVPAHALSAICSALLARSERGVTKEDCDRYEATVDRPAHSWNWRLVTQGGYESYRTYLLTDGFSTVTGFHTPKGWVRHDSIDAEWTPTHWQPIPDAPVT